MFSMHHTRQEFQAYFSPRNLGPGDMEELSPELWEEFRLDGAADDLHMPDLAEEEVKVLNKTLIEFQGYLRPQDCPG